MVRNRGLKTVKLTTFRSVGTIIVVKHRAFFGRSQLDMGLSPYSSAHQMGSARMGSDPKTSMVDPDLNTDDDTHTTVTIQERTQ